MQIDIHDLNKQQINFLVAQLEGYKYVHVFHHQIMVSNKKDSSYDFDPCGSLNDGIIERERISIRDVNGTHWEATASGCPITVHSGIASIAAMRAYVAKRCGLTIDIADFPDELKNVRQLNHETTGV